MTADRDLERQLAALLDQRAMSTAPDGLLSRSLARVDRTRQRRRWLVGDQLPVGSSRLGRAFLPAWAILLLVILAALAMVATGARLFLLSVPATIVEASPSPSSSTLASIEPSAEPTPARTVDNALVARRGMFASLTDFLVASDTVGWVKTEAPPALYRTTDMGRTWTEVRPNGWPSTSSTAFVDAGTMYAALTGSPAKLAATHDGGATWVETTLDVAAITGGPVFSFQTPSSGFATFYDPEGTSPFRIYATTDGGATWTGPASGTVPHMAASFDKLSPPIGGFLWQSAGKADNKPFDNRFFLSADGGATWTKYTFPIADLAPKDALKNINGILQEDNGRILLSIDVDGGRKAIPEAIYESGADTATWRLVQALPAGGTDVQFLSPTDWVIFSTSPSEIRTTTDAGLHWHTTVSSTSLYGVQPSTAHQFATINTGWAVEECRNAPGAACPTPHAKVFLITTDGGATWARIGQ
jgi:photosystem II stability/assembly factor-like uncharacterized protein